MTTPHLAHAIEAEEGRRLAAYPDPLSPLGKACARAGLKPENYRSLANWHALNGGPWTIGVGHTGSDVKEGAVWTDAQVSAALDADIEHVKGKLDSALPWWRDLSGPRQDVLVQMGFQIGVVGLLAFHRTLDAMRAGNFSLAATGMRASLWARQTPHRAERLARIMETGAYPS
jgi:lysozyme